MICKGDEFKDLRRAYAERSASGECLEKWNLLWSERLESWHRKRLYDGIGKVFLSFCNVAGLKVPNAYKNECNYGACAKTLGGIALMRNCFIHGATEVPAELAEFCEGFEALLFEFKKGEKFVITQNELAILEYFTDTFTQTLNTSLFELAVPEAAKWNTNVVKGGEV